jgi:fatty-acyl-CoA synthase/O-succinylbenzoic acid--CoA ligase
MSVQSDGATASGTDAAPGDGPLRHLVGRLAEAAPDAPAIVAMDGAMATFAELSARADDLAAEIPEGARRVAVGMANDVESVARLAAVWSRGASAVLLGALLPDAEAQRRVDESHSDSVLGRPSVCAGLAPGFSPADDAEALVVFTSGTTGRPKGAVLSFGALSRSLLGIARGSRLPDAGRLPTTPPRPAAPVFTPMAHMAGALGVLSAWYTGKPVLMVPKFDVQVALRLVDEHGINVLKLTPAMVYDLAHLPERRALGGVRSVTVGTAGIPDATREAFEERYGVPVLRNYGQTEFSGAIAFERIEDVRAGRRPSGTVGRIAPGVEVRVVDPDGTDLPPGQPGEIVARGGGSMTGYLGPDGRPVPPGPQGWVHTGDLGVVDADGFVFILGRVREMILCGGFNVYPAVVEAALNRLPGIVDSAVAGAPDPRLGEVPVAVLVTDGEPPSLDELRTALREELAPYEIPRRVVFDAALPRTENGKIDRPGVLRRIEESVAG